MECRGGAKSSGAMGRVYSRDVCLVATQSTGLRSTADLWHPVTFAVVGAL